MGFKSGAVLSLFPTLIIVRDLPPEKADQLNADIANRLAATSSDRRISGEGGAWQTPPDLHHMAELQQFNRYVLDAATEFLELMDYRPDPIEITGCWTNTSPPGAAHRVHSHPNNLFSGVYYVQVAPGANSIDFYDPRPQAHVIAPHLLKTSGANASVLSPEARAGRFYLFPGWLQHSVPINRSDRYRISVSFNIMFTSFTQDVSRPRWRRHIVGHQNPTWPTGCASGLHSKPHR